MKINKTGMLRSQRGSVLFLSLMVTMALMVLGIGYVGNQTADFRLSGRSHGWIQAENIAEAGIELAIWEVNSNGELFDPVAGWTGSGSAADPFIRSGQLTIEGGSMLGDFIVGMEGDGNVYTATSQSFFPSQADPLSQRQITVQMERLPLFQYAVAGLSNITANNRLDIFGDDVRLVTNATGSESIKLGPSSQIHGDVLVGPGGDSATDIVLGPGGEIFGETGTLNREISPEPIVMPTGFTATADIDVPNNVGWHTINGGDWEISNIKVGNRGVLEITAPTRILVTESFEMRTDSELIIRDGASLELYADVPVVNFAASTSINSEAGDPLSFIIYGSENVGEVRLGSKTEFSGAVYAPSAWVRMLNNGTFTGALIGDQVTFGPAMVFNYDNRLRNLGPREQIFTVQLWHSIDPA